ncbi:hypothetical protein IGI37_000237 [Enterococcus sp. AZ194]|uniref:hypothetical protein n=1 Tax=Enterococcus sp. AZ194 TaxID=2774629 RepID=UPI003F2731B5
MLNQIQSDVKLSNELSATFSELKLALFLKKAWYHQSKRYLSVDAILFSFIFEGKTLFGMLTNWRSSTTFKKDTIYRFMNNPLNNWRKFLLSISSFVIGKLHQLTDSSSQARVLIVNHSFFYRTRSQQVENLACNMIMRCTARVKVFVC